MSYRLLYAHCQGLDGRIGRRHLFPKVSELTGISKPRMQLSGKLDTENLLGYIYFPDGTDSALTQYCHGKPLIVVARDLSPSWHRLVMVKELMHYFDLPLEKVSSARDFENLMSGITARMPVRSPAVFSEDKAIWMAYGVMCPEARRQELQRARETGELDDKAIGDLLGMPTSAIGHLFDPSFKDIIEFLLKQTDA